MTQQILLIGLNVCWQITALALVALGLATFGNTPFGGTIRGPWIPCTCSFNGFVIGGVRPVPGGISAPVMFFSLYRSRLFANYRPFPGRLTLGLRNETPGASCSIYVVFSCVTVPYAATINKIGTE